MGTHTSALSRLLVVLMVLGFAGLTATVALSQAPGQKPPPKEEEEEPNVKPKPKDQAKPKPGEEEEDPNFKPKKTKVIRVGDENMDTQPVKPAPAANAPLVTDLMTAYRAAKVPAFREFYFSIAEPHDLVSTNASGKVTIGGALPQGSFRVRPLEEYLGTENPRFTGRLRLKLFQEHDWIDDKPWEVQSGYIKFIAYYEQIVVDRVDRFLTGNKTEESLRAAQAALTAALSFHESAREQNKRRGDGFAPLAAAVREKLLRVQLDQLDLYIAAKRWDKAVSLASGLADTFTRPEEQARIVGPLTAAIKKAIEDPKQEVTDEQLQRLQQIEILFPGTASAPVRAKLKERAQELFNRAKAIVKEDPAASGKALLLVKQAENMFPRLAELRDFRLSLENKLSELRVGVRELPRHLSPGLAFTDSEKQAVELMFESLMELGADADGNPRWTSSLCQGVPRTVPLGRQFHIGRDAFWSNDKPVTPDDVRHTVRLLRNPKWPGHSTAWADLVEEPTGGDPAKVTLTLRQGYLDPLSLMTFKVLPVEPWGEEGLVADKDKKFDEEPVGSGPYKYNKRGNVQGRQMVSFTANPSYGSRPGKFGLPSIREVQFFKTTTPAQDIIQKKLDVVTDLATRDVASVQSIPTVKVVTMPNRRVWFLAINHRKPALENQKLRAALAHAIDREAVLNGAFRHNLGPTIHKPLNSPFPAGSWAADPGLSFSADLARIRIKEAEAKGLKKVKLSLKYPGEDQDIAAAMALVAKQVQETIGVTLEPQPVEPHELRNQVEGSHDYDLAYYSYDFTGTTFWLWPLFDPKATERGGTNYLGYQNDGALEAQFGQIMGRREFGEVKKLTHTLHGMLFEKMPLIPLWQLDTHLALHNDLVLSKDTEIAKDPTKAISDPLLVFTKVEEWRFDKK